MGSFRRRIVIAHRSQARGGEVRAALEDDFRFFETYAMSVVYLVREVLPAMKAKGWGRIVAIGSGAAKEPEA